MIIDIAKGKYVKGLIEYHEKKVQQGKAELLFDNTLAQDKSERIKAFLETAELNPRIYRNKFIHFSVSFPKADSVKVDPELMLSVANDYLKEMGYVDTPVLIYEHADKKHKHFHIVTTAMDYSGAKIPELNDHLKSQALTRRLENSFGLEKTEYVSKFQKQLAEKNSVNYRIFNALSSKEGRGLFESEMKGLMPENLQESVRANKLSDYEVQKELETRGISKENLYKIYRTLKSKNLFYQTNKDVLNEKLNHIKSVSKSRDQFLEQAERQGIYVRKIAKGEGVYSLTYGLADKNFYVKEKDLPVGFRYDFLFTDRKIELSYDREQQRGYLKRMVSRNLRQSQSKAEFESRLTQAGVQIKYAENTRGIYGVSFSSANMKQPEIFKASDLSRDLTWNKIAQQLNVAPTINVPKESPSLPSQSQGGPNIKGITDPLSKARGVTDDEEERRRRKRERDNEREQDNNL